ncbi:MAG: NUDIX hydrolase [Chlorobi bacterium]|nr:NUDIX hydrolase [Chlorobiota bacterium]MBX7217938.1 NUDIX hydrolase [Candidatus Kapabacteria bacterium]
MLTIDDGQRFFNYRIAGVAIHNGKVLVHRGPGDDFWTLPGGRAEMGETAAETLQREMIEELNTTVEVGEPLWFVENFFEYNNRSFHELGLYFSMTFPPDSPLLELEEGEFQDEIGVRLIFRWQPIEALAQIAIAPTCIAERLPAVGLGFQHIVHRDDASATRG